MSEPKVLLVYDESVEGTKLYLLPREEANKYRSVLEGCQNKFINSDDCTPDMEQLSAMLATKPEHVPNPDMQQYACIWTRYLVPLEEPLHDVQIVRVYYSGFLP